MYPLCVHRTAFRSAVTKSMRKTSKKWGCANLRYYCFISGVCSAGLAPAVVEFMRFVWFVAIGLRGAQRAPLCRKEIGVR